MMHPISSGQSLYWHQKEWEDMTRYGNTKLNKTIALDADGVLLDYATAYAHAWERAFGVMPELLNRNAYWPTKRWKVDWLEGESLRHFRSVFDEQFWSSIPPITGALEACQLLSDSGYELICVTALEHHHGPARERNLKKLGYPISRVITTDSSNQADSPKAEIINGLELVAFVDDYSPYLRGVNGSVHKALILRDPDGSPNVGDNLQLADSLHMDILDFARWWVSGSGSGSKGI